MSKEKDNDNIDINLHLNKSKFKTQVTLFIGLILVYFLSKSTPVHVVCIVLGVLDIVSVCISYKSETKEEPTATEPVKDKPKEKERVRVVVPPEPAVTDESRSTESSEEPAEETTASTMTADDWSDFFASLDEGK